MLWCLSLSFFVDLVYMLVTFLFTSDPLDENSPPIPVCASIPPLSTKSPTGQGGVITSSSPSVSDEGNTGLIISFLSYIRLCTLFEVITYGSAQKKPDRMLYFPFARSSGKVPSPLLSSHDQTGDLADLNHLLPGHFRWQIWTS